MTPKHRVLFIGAATGLAGSTATLALAAWLGVGPGTALGMLASAALGATGSYTAFRIFHQLVTDQFISLDSQDWGLSAKEPEPTGSREFDETLARFRGSVRRARETEAQWEEPGAMARSIWSAVHAMATKPPPVPDTPACVEGVLKMFRQTAETLIRYASSLEEANERMASGALDQSDTVSRTTTTVEALSDKIDRISQHAENATEACERTRLEARQGLEQVHQVIEGMERLRSQIEANGRKARRLGDRSVEIGTIVEMIRGISGRTDMLALNATIESVRAGEHGRGFAVVAEEIRKLSERTATATRDIGTLVEAIQADTHESIRALAEEQSEMEQESQRVRGAGAALERISQVAEHSAQLVDGISRSTNDQVLAAQELVRGMQRISDVSQITLERSTQSRESIRNLASLCERLAPLSSADLLESGRTATEPMVYTKEKSSVAARRSRRLATSEKTS